MNNVNDLNFMIIISFFLYLNIFISVVNILYSNYNYTGKRKRLFILYCISNLIGLFVFFRISIYGYYSFHQGVIFKAVIDLRYFLIFTIASRIHLIVYLLKQEQVLKKRVFFHTLKVILLISLTPFLSQFISDRATKTLFYITTILMIDENLSLVLRFFFGARTSITYASISEAFDKADMGAIFINKKGKVVMINKYATDFIERITKKRAYWWGDIHYEITKENEEFSYEVLGGLKNNGIIRFNDGQSFKIVEKEICVNNKEYTELDIYEVTVFDRVMRKLKKQNSELEVLNDELSRVIKGIEQITFEKELINLRHKVHDIIAHRLSIIVASIQELEILGKSSASEEQLHFLLNNMLKDLKSEHLGEVERRLDNLVESFKVIGVDLIVSGSEVREKKLKEDIISIFREATTNAIRHANATKVFMNIIDEEVSYTISIWNNGKTKVKDVIEGTGLKGIRRTVESNDGEIEFLLDEFFTIRIKIKRPIE